jgi:hypothetical protein
MVYHLYEAYNQFPSTLSHIQPALALKRSELHISKQPQKDFIIVDNNLVNPFSRDTEFARRLKLWFPMLLDDSHFQHLPVMFQQLNRWPPRVRVSVVERTNNTGKIADVHARAPDTLKHDAQCERLWHEIWLQCNYSPVVELAARFGLCAARSKSNFYCLGIAFDV